MKYIVQEGRLRFVTTPLDNQISIIIPVLFVVLEVIPGVILVQEFFLVQIERQSVPDVKMCADSLELRYSFFQMVLKYIYDTFINFGFP